MLARLIVLFLIFQVFVMSGQAPGLVIQGGLTSTFSKDPIITKNGEAHYGWLVGADARILEGDLYFIVGGQYSNTSLRSSSAPNFFVKRDWKQLSGRFGIGFNLWRISEKVSFRSKLLGSINFLMDAPKDALQIVGYETLNDSYLGAVSGLGLTLGMFDFDLEYQYGLINAYQLQSKSKFSGITLLAGFHF